MTLIEISAAITVALISIGTVWYIVEMFVNPRVVPVLPSWFVIAVTMNLAFAMYWTTKNHSIVTNACLGISALSALLNLIAVLIRSWVKKDWKPLSPFQKFTLLVSAIITIFWAWLVWGPLKGTGMIPYICMQVLLAIGYAVTVQKLMTVTKNTESMMWTLIGLGGFVAVYTGYVTKDWYAFWNAIRGAVSAGTVVFFMVRLNIRNQRNTET